MRPAGTSVDVIGGTQGENETFKSYPKALGSLDTSLQDTVTQSGVYGEYTYTYTPNVW